MSYQHPHQPYPQQPQHLPGPPSPDSPTTSTHSSSRKRARPADMDQHPPSGAPEYKDYYAPAPVAAAGYYDPSGGPPAPAPQDDGGAVGATGFAIEHGDGDGEADDDDERECFEFCCGSPFVPPNRKTA